MANYLGTTMLDLTEPDRAAGTSDLFERRLIETNTQTGIRSVFVPGPTDVLVRQFEWVCFSRSEVKTLKTFIEGRLGRGLPFWLMTWERDLELSASYVLSDPTITVRECGYSALIFPAGNYRKHLSLRGDSGTFYQRRITAAVDNLDGTETLTLETSIAEAITAPGLLSFLRYCRLDTDEPRIEWEGGHYARSILPIRELPRETIA